MAYVSQLQRNDCLRACVATILSVRPESLPSPPTEFTDDNWDGYFEELRQAVRVFGFELLLLKNDDGFVPQGLSIAAYPSPGKTDKVLHAVVAKDGEVIWDPSRGYREIGVTYEGPPHDWTVFQALEPASLTLKNGATNEHE